MKMIVIGIFNFVCAIVMLYALRMNYAEKRHWQKILETIILMICFLLGIHHIGTYIIVDVQHKTVDPIFDSVWFIGDILNGMLAFAALFKNLEAYREIHKKTAT